MIFWLNTRTGGVCYAFHLFFANISKTAAGSAAKFGMPAHKLGIHLRSPGQLKVRCALRIRLQN